MKKEWNCVLIQKTITGKTNSRGISFTIDAGIAVVIMLLMLYIFAYSVNSLTNENLNEVKEFSFYRKAISLSDSLIKNRNETSPEKGSAVYDERIALPLESGLEFDFSAYKSDTKRVIENKIDYGLIKKADFSKIDIIDVKKVEIEFGDGETEKIFEKNIEGDCIAVERFVIIKQIFILRKGKISIEVCENE